MYFMPAHFSSPPPIKKQYLYCKMYDQVLLHSETYQKYVFYNS